MKKFFNVYKKIPLFFILYSLFLNANVAFAQSRLIPCSGLDCNLCDLLELAKNVINWLVSISSVLAVGFIIWGSIVIMTAGASPERANEGKKIITTAVIGLVIVLASWLILGTIIQIVTGSPSALPWKEIKCTF